jgi:RNA polymerase sigma-70 factor (ECF subfamily)
MARIGSREVDDASQEVFLRAFRGLSRLESAANFPAYLGQIARNFCVDHLRSSPRHRTTSLDEVELEVEDPRRGDSHDPDDRTTRLRREIARLPENQRECLLLFHFEELSYQEIADVLGLTAAAVNQRLSRARARLRSLLADVDEGGVA